MRIGDTVYFAPNYTFTQLLTDPPEKVVDAYEKRIKEYYLVPAEILNQNQKAFGAGVLCMTAIDAIAKYEIGGSSSSRFKEWISNLQDFNKLEWKYIERIYKEFRNGLVHEGRIKNAGQFTYDIKKAVEIRNEVILINPDILLANLETEFSRHIKNVKENSLEQAKLSDKIKRVFNQDIIKLGEEEDQRDQMQDLEFH